MFDTKKGTAAGAVLLCLVLSPCRAGPVSPEGTCQANCEESIARQMSGIYTIYPRLVDSCTIGCRWRHIDLLTSLSSSPESCLNSCQEAYASSNEQMSCTVGCNMTTYNTSQVYTSLSLFDIAYDVLVASIGSISNAWNGNVMELTTVTVEDQNGQIETVIYVVGSKKISSQTATPPSTTGLHEDTTTTNSNSIASYEGVWFMLQLISVLLLLLSIAFCCCLCAGEARNRNKLLSRSREISNCKEESDIEVQLYKHSNPLAQPLATPIATYTRPVQIGVAPSSGKVMVY